MDEDEELAGEESEEEDSGENDAEFEEDDEEPLFGRIEAAALLAVEAANGGELADLEQVIVAYYRLFHRWPDVDDFTLACQLLCEAGMTNYVSGCLELDPTGRKLLRRSGLPRHQDRPFKVVQLMQDIDEHTLAEEGSIPEPTEEEVANALDMVRGQHTLASAITPPPEPGFLLSSPIAGAQFSFTDAWADADDSIPLVAAADDEDEDDDAEDEDLDG